MNSSGVCLKKIVCILQVFLENLCNDHPTSLNNLPVKDTKVVAHNDVFTVADRLFRVEFPHGPPSHVLRHVSNVMLHICKKKTFE